MTRAAPISASPGPPTPLERALLLACGLALATAAEARDCAALAKLDAPGIRITAAVPVDRKATCRVTGVARPVTGSNIGFEVWLPAAWNGRYYQLGNGGFGGSVHAPSLAAEAARGNAAASTDTGHRGDAFDARWAASDTAVVDYGERSIKATADAAALLIAAYYGKAAKHRYFAGCSNGGRQALIAAQRYPRDWEGIVAGAPAHRWTAQLADFAAIQHQLRAVPGGWLPPAKLPAIERAARRGFDPGALLCAGRETDDCLTSAQIVSLRLIVAKGFAPHEATTPDGWARWIVNPDTAAPSQLTFATQAARHLPGTRQIDGRSVSWIVDADATDLSAFAARGGRLLSYFGTADAVLSPAAGLAYYRSVAARMGLRRTARFYRLFMVPGMAHCQGGRGATSFGQAPVAPPARADRRHDIRRALEAWVERGIAPSELIATGPGVSQRLVPVR